MKALWVMKWLLLMSLWLNGVQSQVGSKCTFKKNKLLSNGDRIQILLDNKPECAKGKEQQVVSMVLILIRILCFVVIERACEPTSMKPIRKLWRPHTREIIDEVADLIESLGLDYSKHHNKNFLVDLRYGKLYTGCFKVLLQVLI